METPDKNSIGESRGNSLSSGDPKINTETNTSTDSSSDQNTGESAPQQGENIVNEQEQHKTVNMEEFVENSAQNRLGDNEGSLVPSDATENGSTDKQANTGDNVNETNSKIPTMKSGAL